MKTIRYAVVGLGNISQVAVLPAFNHHHENFKLTALVSGNQKKLQILGKKYGVSHLYSYEDYDQFLQAGVADAVYIALPNTLHAEYSIKAAQAGLHILCEKPMATSEKECRAMIEAAKKNHVQLMIAYRLHFESANLNAIKIIEQGKLGKPRIFNSTFTRQTEPGDIRLKEKLGGGSVWDLGIYCINAARYLFQDEPTHVLSATVRDSDPRFHTVDEMTSAILRFPQNRLASFTCSFGAADSSFYDVIGSKGVLRMEPAYEYSVPQAYRITVNEKTKSFKLSKRDQFGAQLRYFADCIRKRRKPEPSGEEGLIDTQIITAIYEAAAAGRVVKLDLARDKKKVRPNQKISLPGVKKPKLVNA